MHVHTSTLIAGDPHFFFQKHILFTIISPLSKNEQKINVGRFKNFKFSVRETSNPAILQLQGEGHYGR